MDFLETFLFVAFWFIIIMLAIGFLRKIFS